MGRRGVGVGRGPELIAAALDIPTLDIGTDVALPQVNQAIAAEVAHGRRLIIAGNCSSCLGALAGLPAPAALQVLWFDAHGDFNTAETSLTGCLDGMCLNFATRDFVDPAGVTLLGTRDLDAAEPDLISAARIRVIPAADFHNTSFLPSGRVYLHIDIDVLDPAESPGTACRTPGGLTPHQLTSSLDSILRFCTVEAAAITNFNPDLDPDGLTLGNCLRIAKILLAH